MSERVQESAPELSLKADASLTYYSVFPGNGIYIFVLEGQVHADGKTLQRRDGLGITQGGEVAIDAVAESQLLAIEVPMFA